MFTVTSCKISSEALNRPECGGGRKPLQEYLIQADNGCAERGEGAYLLPSCAEVSQPPTSYQTVPQAWDGLVPSGLGKGAMCVDCWESHPLEK